MRGLLYCHRPFQQNPSYSTSPVIGSTVNTAALTHSLTTDYVGNIIYENGTLKRILVNGGYYESGNYYFYINDHLGNNRIVTDAAAAVVQSTQYYPFGASFADASGTSTQPYKYNGKELDTRNGLNLYDYSARYYESAIGRFTTVDPMAEMYYSISPYAYCANNPIKFIDPTGMVIDSLSLDDWNSQKDKIISTRNKLIEKNKKGKNDSRIASLNNTLKGMGLLEESTDTYSLNKISGEEGGISLDGSKIVISYGSTSNFVHELTHGVQYENGDVGFWGNKAIGQDLFDEVDAYKAQYNFDPSSVSDLNSSSYIQNENDITTSWVQNISMSNGTKPYSVGGSANTGIVPLNSMSTKADIIRAYPNQNSFDLQRQYGLFKGPLKNLNGAKFKR